jgi:putative methyltransferase (TIGR04325 family)
MRGTDLISMGANAPTTHIWNGIFPNWVAACEATKEDGDVFASDRWLDRITQHLVEYRKAVATDGLALPPRPSNLPFVAALTRSHTITDFGGSSGWCFDYLRDTAPQVDVRSYSIIEIDRIVAHMRASGLQSPPVTYKTPNDELEKCDLLYGNSVLQYFASNSELLDLIERTTPGHLLLDDVLGKGEEDFFTTQAYYGSAIAHRFIGLGRLVNELKDASYELLARTPFASPILGMMKPLPMQNFPLEYRVRHAVSLLFRRFGS